MSDHRINISSKQKLDFGRMLLKIGAIKFGIFKLTSGKMSPYYIDLRIIPSFPKTLETIIGLYKQLITQSKVDNYQKIGGVPTSGLIFSAILAYQLEKPFIYVRPERKKHGHVKRVEGLLYPGDKIILVDDLITTGKSIVSSIEALRSEGGEVNNVLVLINREEGGVEALKKLNVIVHSFISITEIMDLLRYMEAITEEQFEKIIQHIKQY